jgi:hypothetical protein
MKYLLAGTCLRLSLVVFAVLPCASLADDATFLRLAQAAQRDVQFEECANACQAMVDRRIAQCPGYREIQDPGNRYAPPPQCKKAAIEEFESCRASCPASRFQPQG